MICLKSGKVIPFSPFGRQLLAIALVAVAYVGLSIMKIGRAHV